LVQITIQPQNTLNTTTIATTTIAIITTAMAQTVSQSEALSITPSVDRHLTYDSHRSAPHSPGYILNQQLSRLSEGQRCGTNNAASFTDTEYGLIMPVTTQNLPLTANSYCRFFDFEYNCWLTQEGKRIAPSSTYDDRLLPHWRSEELVRQPWLANLSLENYFDFEYNCWIRPDGSPIVLLRVADATTSANSGYRTGN
jgi:hypothetical protein